MSPWKIARSVWRRTFVTGVNTSLPQTSNRAAASPSAWLPTQASSRLSVLPRPWGYRQSHRRLGLCGTLAWTKSWSIQIPNSFSPTLHRVWMVFLNATLIALVTEYFPMDLYRSMFFINTLDHDYNRTISLGICISNLLEALESFDQLARKLYNTSLSDNEVSKIKLEMSRNLNLMMANRNETLAEATRLYETVDPPPLHHQRLNCQGRSIIQYVRQLYCRSRREPPKSSLRIIFPPKSAPRGRRR